MYVVAPRTKRVDMEVLWRDWSEWMTPRTKRATKGVESNLCVCGRT